MQKRVFILTSALLIGMMMWLPGMRSRRVAAQSATLSGSYGFTFASPFTGAISNPLVGVGVITFDGAGNLSGNETVVVQDPSPNARDVQTIPVPFAGTYTVNADGTGTMKLQVQIPNVRPTTVSFVVTDGGSGVYFVNTGGDNFLSTGTARKQ